MRKIVILISLNFCFTIMSMEDENRMPIYKQYNIRNKYTVEDVQKDGRFEKKAENYWSATETITISSGPKDFTTKIIFSGGIAVRIDTTPDPDMLDDFPNFSHNKQNSDSFFSSTIKRRLAFIIIGAFFLYFLKRTVDNQTDDLVS